MSPPAAHAAGTPTVFVAPATRAHASGTATVNYWINVSSMVSFNGFNILVKVDPLQLAVTSISTTHIIFANPSEDINCVNNTGIGCVAGLDAPGIAHEEVFCLGCFASGNGLLFNVTFTNVRNSVGAAVIDVYNDVIDTPPITAPHLTVDGSYLSSTGGTPADYSVSASPFSQSIPQGQTGTAVISLHSVNSFAGTLALNTASVAAGLPVTLNSTSVVLTAGLTKFVAATISPTSLNAGGAYDLIVNASGGTPNLIHAINLNITVLVPNFTIVASPTSFVNSLGFSNSTTLTLTSINTFAAKVTLSFTVTPNLVNGPTITLSNGTSTGSSVIVTVPSGGTGTATLTSSSTSATATNSYSIMVTGTGGGLSRSTSISTSVVPFSISASPVSLSLTNSTTSFATSTITLNSQAGVAITVTLSSTVSPSTTNPLKVLFTNATLTGNPIIVHVPAGGTITAVMNVTVTCSGTPLKCTLPNTYTVKVTGTVGTASRATNVAAVVSAAGVSDFTISATPPVNFNAGATGAATTVTVTAVGTFTGTVTLTPTSPAGLTTACPASVTLPPSPATASCTFTSTTPGVYGVTITGTGGGHTHSAAVTVHVGDFSITATSPADFNTGATGSSTITITPSGGFTGAVSLTTVVSPSTGLAANCPTSLTVVSGAVTGTCAPSSSTPGTYLVTITGTGGGHTHSATFISHVGDFSISAGSPVNFNSGATGSAISVSLTSTFNFVGTVAPGDTVPAGLTCQSFSPSAAVSLATNGTGTANLSCTSTTVNAFNVNISGVGSPGTASHSTTATFTFTGVVDYTIGVSSPADFNTGATGSSTITITPLNGFMGTVTLTTVISPSTGLTANCPTSLTVTTGVVTGTCSPSSSAPGTYGISISASGGGHAHTNSFASHVGDFSISVGGPVNFNSGATGSAISVSLASTFNFAGTVSLAAVNIPATGLTVTCPAPVSITANATVAASCSLASTAAGTYGATITGIGSPGTASHFAVATVHVGDFSISATSPSGATSTSISSSITLTSTFNFVGSVALGDTVPSGLTCQPFSPTATVPLSANGTGMASISCTSTTANAFIVGINGVGSPGTASHSTTATFTFTGLVDFTISATSPADFNTGTTGSSTITITPIGSFTGAVTLTTVVSPSTGLTANCATSLTVTSGAVTGTCTPSSSTPGTYTVSITATGGGRTHTVSFVSHVGDFTISATSPSGAAGSSISSTITLTSTFNFVGTFALSDTPLPAGLTCNAFIVTPVSLAANGTGTSSLSCTSPTTGSFVVNISAAGTPGTASHPTTATFTFTVGADFAITASSPADFNTGATGSSTVTITPSGGFTGAVSLTTVVSPSTALAANCPTSLTVVSGAIAGTCAPSSSTPGTYLVTVTGTGGGHTHSATFISHVGDFTISVGSPVNFNSGATGSAISVSLTSTFNFAGTVSLAAITSPVTGLTVTCPAPVSITANATVTASCSLASTTAGTYGVTVTGAGSPGTASHSALSTVPVGDFSISATSPSGATGSSISSTITLTSTFNFVGTVALGDTVPSGLTCQPFSPTATVPLSA